MNELLSYARCIDRVRVTVPNEITEAWVHLVLGLVNLERSEHAERLLDDASRLLSESAIEIVKALSQKSLEESSTILPLEIFSLVALKLIQSIPNVPGTQTDDISQIYRARLDKIVSSLAD